MALFGKKGVSINKYSSEAEVKGRNGSFIHSFDLEDYLEGQVGINADIFTAVMEIVPKIARMQLKLTRNEEDVGKNQLVNLMNEKPNEWESAYQFKFHVIKESILKGNSYVELLRDGKGNIVGLQRLNHDNVRILNMYDHEDQTRILGIRYLVGKDEDNQEYISSENMLHFKPFNLSEDGVAGESLVNYLRTEVKISEGISKLHDNYLRTGGNLGGQVKVNSQGGKLNDEDKEILKDAWRKTFDNYSPVYITDDYSEFIPNEQSGEVLNNLLNNKTASSKVAQVFKLPLHTMGVATSNMSLSQLNQDFLNNTLTIYLEMYVTELNDKFFRVNGDYEQSWEFDSQVKVSAMDLESRKMIVDLAMKNGFIKGNEARVILGLGADDSEALEQFRVSLNSVNSEVADSYQLGGKGVNEERGDGID